MGTIGYALLLILNDCANTGAGCETKPVTNTIYQSETDCEWELQRQAAYYGSDKLVCARVEGESKWQTK